MGVHKFAISVPEEVMARVDEAAQRRGVTRSRFITDVLRKVARAQRDADITRRLDELFGRPDVAREQRRSSRELVTARVDDGEW
jgi:metal-responsive CopG/Arc/MetJ family transcriptional regulator